jgi:hypothetical protein
MSQLTTLASVQLQIPNAPSSDDTLLSNLITVASAVIETYCNRTFAQATYDELHSVIGPTCSMWVNNSPVTDLVALRSSELPAIYIQCNDPSNQCQFAIVNVTSTGVTLQKMFNNVLVTNQTFSFTSYPTFASLEAGINALGNGWVATQPNQFALWQTSDLTTNQTGKSARNIFCPLTVYWYYHWGQKVNKDLGLIEMNGGAMPGYQVYRVTYTGGYATIPPEISQACNELVQILYSSRNLDLNLDTEALDKYSYTRAAENSFKLLSLASKLAIAQYKAHRFTVQGVPATE